MTKRPIPTSFGGNGSKGGSKGSRPGATALAALSWLSAFAVLWLWVFDLIAVDGLSALLLMLSLTVAIVSWVISEA